MANIVYNTLELSAQIESTLDQATTLFQDYSVKYSFDHPFSASIFNKDTNTHVCTWEFASRWAPPLTLYAELKAIKGVSVEAAWTDEADHWDIRYRWTGEGNKYEVIETDLTYSKKEKAQLAARQASEDLIRERIKEMCQERDDLNVAIRVMERRYTETKIPF